MKQVSITGPNEWVLGEVEAPRPPDGWLLIAPLRVGICGTDVELLDGSMVYFETGQATRPLTPGHEWAGCVIGWAPGVTGFSVGQVVTGENLIGCGHCELCAAGQYAICEDRCEAGLFGLPGALSGFIVRPREWVYPLPGEVSLADAAMIEPTTVSYRGIKRLRLPQDAQKVHVIGGGTLGYIAAELLRSEAFGLDVAVSAKRPESIARAISVGARLPEEGERFPFAIEVAGGSTSVADGLRALLPGGRLVSIGFTGLSMVPIPLDQLVVQDQEIIGSLAAPGVWPEVVDLIARKVVHPSALVTDEFSLDEYGKAIDLLNLRLTSTGKVLIHTHESVEAAQEAAIAEFGAEELASLRR
ncbi:MAG: alcohol dehydrogenase catalytic domain-containing protein [Propionibacteriaceae bacterium]|jgi:threonine dehydrogenase-like Zn-dependent dehydrogenase|nr:alcohol dehydrogenase catalytic domain-containing protein [Propionibacteriaceae bacterium]